MMVDNHVLLLTPGFPKDEDDFLCTPPVQDYLLKCKEIFPKTKFSVIAFQYPYKKINYKWNGIDVYGLGGNNLLAKKIFVWITAVNTAKSINSILPVTSIHSLWFGECALVGYYLSRKLKCNHICTFMGQDVQTSNYYLKILNTERIKIISLSQNQSNEFYKITKRKVDDEIYWGIENQECDLNTIRDIDLLAVGSLIPLKNYSLFIKTIAEIVKEFPKLVCKLVGNGPDFSELKTMAVSYGVDNNIEFTGLLSRKEIFKLMKQSKIFVHPSKFEGSGFVFAEALVNGMNIISFDVGYAKQSDRWYVAKDENHFVGLTKELLNNNLNHEPKNIFPISETVDKYHQLYNDKFQ